MDSALKKGIVIGIIVPLIIGCIVKIIFYNYISFNDLITFPKLLSPFIQWGIIGNLLVFFYFMQKNATRIQQGLILPTIIYALLAVVTKMFL